MERKLVLRPAHISSNPSLPSFGKDVEWLRAELGKLQKMYVPSAPTSKEGSAAIEVEESWQEVDGQDVWQGGKISGAVYHGGQEMSDLLADAIKMFMVSNPVSITFSLVAPRSFPLTRIHACSSTRTSSPACAKWKQRS